MSKYLKISIFKIIKKKYKLNYGYKLWLNKDCKTPTIHLNAADSIGLHCTDSRKSDLTTIEFFTEY